MSNHDNGSAFIFNQHCDAYATIVVDFAKITGTTFVPFGVASVRGIDVLAGCEQYPCGLDEGCSYTNWSLSCAMCAAGRYSSTRGATNSAACVPLAVRRNNDSACPEGMDLDFAAASESKEIARLRAELDALRSG